MRSASPADVRGRQMYLGYAPPPPDPLPTALRRLLAVLEVPAPSSADARVGQLLPGAPSSLCSGAPDGLTVTVRTAAQFRLWLAAARPGDRAVYYKGDEPLIARREQDATLAALADEVLRQSNAEDVPERSACRHIRKRWNGQRRVTNHQRVLPMGLGSVYYAVRL